jgi:hypothetical protein
MAGDVVTFSAPTISSNALMILGSRSFGLSPILFIPFLRCHKKLCLTPDFGALYLQHESTIQDSIFLFFRKVGVFQAAPGMVGACKSSHGLILPF